MSHQPSRRLLAHAARASAAAPIHRACAGEYGILARIPRHPSAADETDRAACPARAVAGAPWAALAEEPMGEGDARRMAPRVLEIGRSEFVGRPAPRLRVGQVGGGEGGFAERAGHTPRLRAGQASAGSRVDLGAAILCGSRGDGEAVA